MIRLALALVWLACVSFQGVAQAMPVSGMTVLMCGGLPPIKLPGGKHNPERDCPGPCHSACRKHEGEGDCED